METGVYDELRRQLERLSRVSLGLLERTVTQSLFKNDTCCLSQNHNGYHLQGTDDDFDEDRNILGNAEQPEKLQVQE